MCGGRSPSAPSAPPRVPEAAQTPVTASQRSRSGGDLERRRRAQGQAGGVGVGTILTGSRGVSDGAATATKTLLGQ